MSSLITILGDSLALHRPWANIRYKDTYPYLLNNLLGIDYTVISRARRGNFITQQIDGLNLMDDTLEESDFYIIHIGIVDCFPRIFSFIERKFINCIRPVFIRDIIIKYFSNNRLFFTKCFKKNYVNKEKFQRNYNVLINHIIKNTRAQKIFIINIADSNEKVKKRNFNLGQILIDYNEILNKIAQNYKKTEIIDFYNLSKNNPDLITEDGNHLTKEANKILAEILFDRIKNAGGGIK